MGTASSSGHYGLICSSPGTSAAVGDGDHRRAFAAAIGLGVNPTRRSPHPGAPCRRTGGQKLMVNEELNARHPVGVRSMCSAWAAEMAPVSMRATFCCHHAGTNPGQPVEAAIRLLIDILPGRFAVVETPLRRGACRHQRASDQVCSRSSPECTATKPVRQCYSREPSAILCRLIGATTLNMKKENRRCVRS